MLSSICRSGLVRTMRSSDVGNKISHILKSFQFIICLDFDARVGQRFKNVILGGLLIILFSLLSTTNTVTILSSTILSSGILKYYAVWKHQISIFTCLFNKFSHVNDACWRFICKFAFSETQFLGVVSIFSD